MITLIKKMDRQSAEKISKWTYEAPYSIYSMDGSEECINELLDGSYYSVSLENGELIGFYCFGNAAKVPAGNQFGVYDDNSYIDVGLGMRPDLCGSGNGYEFVCRELEFAKEMFGVSKFRLTVAKFNKRAIKLYKKAGFRKSSSFLRITPQSISKFMTMKLVYNQGET